jgi:hypothetical protein
MADGMLVFDQGEVVLGGKRIDGILKSMSVGGAVRFDESQQDGASGKVKVPLGWNDADITITLELLTDDGGTCYDRLSRLSAVFKGYDNKSNPKIYNVRNAHLLARGVHQVVFSGLDSDESDAEDVITAKLTFVEHNPPIRKVEERQAAKAGKSGKAPTSTTSKTEPTADKKIGEDKVNPFMQGFNDGNG